MRQKSSLVLGRSVVNLRTYQCKARPCANRIVAIAQNPKAFDLRFILNRGLIMKWKRDLIMKELKIICMKMEHLYFCKACPSTVFTAQAARGVRSGDRQIVVHPLF